MTIAKALTEWLTLYENVSIDTNHINDGSDQYGLFKAPTRTTKEHLEGSYEITEWYVLYVRQASVSEGDRTDSDEWLENLIYWIDDYRFLYEYPEIDGGRRIQDIFVTGTPYPISTDSDDTLYQLSLAITYTRERSI